MAMHKRFSARSTPFLALAAGVFATGCSSFGVSTTDTPAVAPFGAAAAGQAKVCVVRGGDLPAPFFTTVVYDNAKLVGATKDGTYFCYLAEPGKHTIVSDGAYGSRTAVLTAQAGGQYYLKQAWRFPGFLGHALSWIDEPTAQAEIRSNEYAMLTEVPGDVSLPERQPFAPAAR
jgi:hypothetical protein